MKHVSSRLMLLSALFPASPAFAADQFDLICSGIVKPSPEDSQVVRRMQRPISVRYHVDLAQNKWCSGGDACSVRPLAEIDPDILWFERNTGNYRGDPAEVINSVSRTTGAWTWDLPAVHIYIDGTCEPAAFGGFPSPQTKF